MLLEMPIGSITMGNDVARDIHCDATMNVYITMHNDIAMNLFYYVLLCLLIILLFHQ